MSVVKYCPKCSGRPYTRDHSKTNCPYCSAKLETEMIPDDMLAGRPTLPSGSTRSGGAPSFGSPSSNGRTSFGGTPAGRAPSFGGSPSNGRTSFGGTPAGGAPSFGSSPSNGRASFGGTPAGGSSAEQPKPTWGSGNTGGTGWPMPASNPLAPADKNGEGQLTPNGAKQTGLTDPLKSDGKKPLSLGIGRSKLPPEEIRGKVSQYSNTDIEGGRYRRFSFQKLRDAILYGQRTEDLLHRFKVRVSEGVDTFGNEKYTDVEVNVHGTISGGSLIADNSEVEVSGKYKNGVLMARRIDVVNNGYRSPVNFQRSASGTIYAILAAAMLIFLIVLIAKSGGNFVNKLGSLFTAWLITAVVITVLYFAASRSRIGRMARMGYGKRRGFPLLGILLVSLVIALLIVYVFANGNTGSILTGLLSKVISAIVMIVVVYIILKLILGLF